MAKVRSLAGLLIMGLLPLFLGVSSDTPSSLLYEFTRDSSPHVETVLGWMIQNATGKAWESMRVSPAGAAEARQYFELADRSNRLSYAMWEQSAGGPAKTASLSAELSPLRTELDAQRPQVEALIQTQIADVLRESGLETEVAGQKMLFPPIAFRFESPPRVLVVSRRDKIERLGTVLLDPNLSLDEAERLETEIAGDRYSTMVTRIGGLGVYPSMVPESADIRWTLRTVAHEWAHQFLAFRPMGWRYAFGGEDDGRMITVNETTAEIIGREVGDRVFRRLYGDVAEPSQRSPEDPDYLRRSLMDIRKQAEALLLEGRIDEAENYMESSRDALSKKGYSIRKLNQAYFAFNGTYADEPYMAGPQGEDIGGRIRRLRESASSVGEFVWRISSASTYEQFLALNPGH